MFLSCAAIYLHFNSCHGQDVGLNDVTFVRLSEFSVYKTEQFQILEETDAQTSSS